MIDWIKNIINEYPEFWKNYLSKFDIKTNRYVVLSIETDGFDTQNCNILSIGAVSIIDNNILINDSFEIAINNSENNEIEQFINYINNSILIGYHINSDIEIINIALEKMKCGRLKNEAFDVEIMHQRLVLSNEKRFDIDELFKIYSISKPERYFMSNEAFSIAMLFLKLKARLKL